MEVIQVPVSGAIPQPPQGAVVRERSAAPQPSQSAPAPQPSYEFQQPATQAPVIPAQPAAPAAPQVDQNLVALLQALGKQTPAQPTAAPAPTAPVQAPVAGQDPVIDSLQTVLASGGLDVNRAIGRALEEGDASLIDLAYINEKGGAQAEQLRKTAQALVQRQEEIDNRLEQDVYQRFGGEANWDAAISFFASKVPPTTTDYIVGMLKTRNPALIAQASNMVLDYVKQAGAMLTPAGTVQGAAAPSGVQPLGKDEFKREIAKLNPNAPGFAEQRQQLFARRAQGKHLGR